MKAYQVTCANGDHGGDINFAETANKARQQGNGEWCDCEYIDLRAKRAPELDHYAPGPVSTRTLVEKHGWFAFCTQCGRSLYLDDSPVWDGDYAYCSEHAPAAEQEPTDDV